MFFCVKKKKRERKRKGVLNMIFKHNFGLSSDKIFKIVKDFRVFACSVNALDVQKCDALNFNC